MVPGITFALKHGCIWSFTSYFKPWISLYQSNTSSRPFWSMNTWHIDPCLLNNHVLHWASMYKIGPTKRRNDYLSLVSFYTSRPIKPPPFSFRLPFLSLSFPHLVFSFENRKNMKHLATNKRILLPAIILFTLVSLFFIYNLSTTSRDATTSNAPAVIRKKANIIEDTALVDQIQLTRQEWEACLEPGSTPSEYLSIVIVTRVDNYAG